MQQINYSNREGVFESALKGELIVKPNDTEVKLGDCFDSVKNKFIHGVAVLMQSNITNVTRKNKLKKPLLSRAAMATGHVTFNVNGRDIIELPLDVLGYDPDVHPPGSFTQAMMPNGFDTSDSYIKIDGNAITEESVIHFIFYIDPSKPCK